MVTALRTRARNSQVLRTCADEFDITSRIRFNSEVVSLLWEDTRWKLETNDGYVGEFPTCSLQPGCCTTQMFQSSTASKTLVEPSSTRPWDHSVPLDGKKIAVIGTGSTAVQITSALVDSVSEFALFNGVPNGFCRHQTLSSPMRSARISK